MYYLFRKDNMEPLTDKKWREVMTHNVNNLNARLEALEAAAKPANNDDLIEKIKDAHNAMEKVIAHFRRTAAENKNV